MLKLWPHLVKVFSDFLQPQEAKEAKVVSHVMLRKSSKNLC